MSSALSLNASEASWLADVDPALSLLPRALQSVVASNGSHWELHDVRWTPGRGCRLAYQQRSPRSSSTFAAVDVTGAGWSRHDYRDDRRLPGLAMASDPAVVAGRLAQLFDVPIRHCRVEPVRYRPGSRCVLRYDVETAAGPRTLYAKVFRPERFGEVSSFATALTESTSGSRVVPEVAATWPDLQVMLGAAVHGQAVSSVLGDGTVAVGQRARVAHRVGQLLARFHGLSGVAAPRRTAAEHVAAVVASMDAVTAADARAARRLATVLDLVAARVPAADDEVLGHGGFRPGQVMLSTHGRLTVLDIDGVCLCGRGRDLGTALAHLAWHGVREPAQRAVFGQAQRALLSGYESRAGALDPQALLWWRALGLLQVAVRRYRRLEIRHWPSIPALADEATELLAVRQSKTSPREAADLLDARQMSMVLGRALGRGPSSMLCVDSAEELATARGRRTVIRYAVRGLDGPDPVAVIGKAFTDPRRARTLYDHLRVLHEGPFGSGDLRVPEPLALLSEHRLVLYSYHDGTPLDMVSEPAGAEDGVRRAARWLARLHASDVCLPRTFSSSQEQESTRGWASLIGQAHPRLAGPASALAEKWARSARSAACVAQVPIHKDFHPGHVLVGEDLTVIDLDEARQGDPAFDLAHFCCYLELRNSSRGSGSLRSAFLAEYAAATGWTDSGSFSLFCAYTWIKIAKQWAAGSGPCREAPPAGRLAEARGALAKGEACLTG